MVAKITAGELLGLEPRHAAFVIEYMKDFAPRRAAEASGHHPDTGYKLLERNDIAAVIAAVLSKRLEASDVDAEWLLMQAVDNHMIARQQGRISASNTALNLIGRHVLVDAFAAEKVEVNSSNEVMQRLLRGRKRMNQGTDDTDDGDDVSFL